MGLLDRGCFLSDEACLALGELIRKALWTSLSEGMQVPHKTRAETGEVALLSARVLPGLPLLSVLTEGCLSPQVGCSFQEPAPSPPGDRAQSAFHTPDGAVPSAV